MLLFAALVVEHVLCRPGLSVEPMQKIIQADKLYSVSAGVTLLSGFLRVVYSSKGLDFYLDNPVFHLKLGVFFISWPVVYLPYSNFSYVAQGFQGRQHNANFRTHA